MVKATTQSSEAFEAASEARKQTLRASGYVPSSRPSFDWRPSVPSPDNPQSYAGLPPEWDYKNSDIGPNGEQLPNGAIGWTPHGEAYYGGNSAIANWWNRVKAGFSPSAQEEREARSEFSSRASDAFSSLSEGDFGGFFSNTVQAIGQIDDVLANLGAAERPEDANILNHLISGTGTVLAEGVKGLVGGIGEVAEEVEQIRGGLQEASGRADQQAEHPRLAAIQKQLEEQSQRGDTGEWLRDAATWASGRLVNWFVPALYSIEPIGILKDLASIPAAFQNPDEFEAGYNAGRILYTSFIDPTARQEYMRRYRAGENPYLLAEELQNPVAELGGELLADPINLIGLFTKPLRATSRIASAEQSLVRAADEVAEVLVRSADDLDDAARATRVADMTSGWKKLNERVKTGLMDKANDIRFFGGTMEARANFMSSMTGGFFKAIAAEVAERSASGQYVDEVMDIIRGFVYRASDDTAEITKGIDYISRSRLPADMLNSEVAAQTGVMLRKLLENEDGIVDASRFLNRLDNAKGDPAKLIESFRGTLDDAAKAVFPPLRGRSNLGVKARAIAKFEDVSNSKGLGMINRFFASVYMGMSPGYFIRNSITNTFHAFVDGGLDTLYDGAKRITPDIANAGTERLLSYLPEASTKGIGAVGGAPGVATEGATGLNRVFRYFLEKGNESERAMSSRLVYKSVRQTMDRAFVAVRKATEGDLVGVEADTLFRLLRDNNFNVGKAANAYRASAATGVVDPIRTFEYLTDEANRILDDFDLAQPYKERILNTLDEAADLSSEERLSAVQGAHKQFFQDFVEDYLDNMPEEAGRYFTGGALDEGIAAMGDSGAVADNIQDLASKQRGWNKILEDSLTGENGFVTITEKLARKLGVDVDSIKAADPDFAKLNEMVGEAEKAWGSWSEGAMQTYRTARDTQGGADWARYWRQLGIPGKPPSNLTKQQLIRYWWDGYYFPKWRAHWMQVRNDHVEVAYRYSEAILEQAQQLGGNIIDQNALSKAQRNLSMATAWDMAEVGEDGVSVLVGAARADNALALRKLGILNGVATSTDGGANLDRVLLATINKYLPEGTQTFERLGDIPFDTAKAALGQRATEKGGEFIDILGAVPRNVDNLPPVQKLNRAVPYLDDGAMPSDVQMMAENYAGLKQMMGEMEQEIGRMFGNNRRVLLDEQAEASLAAWEKTAGDMFSEARVVAPRVAEQFRNFALIDYSDRRNFDTVLGLLYPYHFWHSRTYANWARRIATNPGIIAGYSKYKDTMSEIHAGLPDWWKYNLNSNELLGMDSENPLFFNIEATLNPVRGLTDVDFNDRYKRVNWWTSLLDDLSKFGPTTWTPLSIATAFALQQQGEDDAAARWGGRLIPQTQTIGSIQALGEKALGPDSLSFLDWFTKDPAVSLFSGGIDPYTRNRVGRALAAMIQEGVIDEETAIDAGTSQEGEIWDMAYDRAVAERAPGQLSSFFFGVGFKGRTASDLTTDQFYNDYFRMWNLRDTLSSEEFQSRMAALEQQYPFMDALLLSRKSGPERDTALAYNVLGRLPPGGSSLAQNAGIDSRLISKFYDTKGDWTEWDDSERDRFMAGVSDLKAVLAIPDSATRQEWDAVRLQYRQMMEQIPERTQENIDAFYAIYFQDKDAGSAYLEQHPEVEAALDYKAQSVASNPQLAAYYGGVDAIEKYYRGLMFTAIEEQMGEDVWDRLDDRGTRIQYAQLRDGYLEQIDAAVLRLSGLLPEARPAQLREDAAQPNVFQEEFIESLATPQVPQSTVISQIGLTAWGIVQDYLQTGDPLPAKLREQLRGIAEQNGVSLYELLLQMRE